MLNHRLKFDDMVELKIGDIIYEGGYGAAARVTVTKKPFFNEEKNQLTWKADVEYFDPDSKSYGPTTICEFCVTRHLEHYGPQLYRTFEGENE